MCVRDNLCKSESMLAALIKWSLFWLILCYVTLLPVSFFILLNFFTSSLSLSLTVLLFSSFKSIKHRILTEHATKYNIIILQFPMPDVWLFFLCVIFASLPSYFLLLPHSFLFIPRVFCWLQAPNCSLAISLANVIMQWCLHNKNDIEAHHRQDDL